MSLQFNVMDTAGKQRFITPIVELTVDGKKVTAKKEVALDLAYIVKAICDSDFSGVTTAGAVAHVGKVVLGMKAGTSYTVYMPTQYADRESSDLKKWTACVTVTQEVIAKAVTLVSQVESTLKMAREALAKAQAEAETLTAKAGIASVTHSQPEYFTGERAKRGSGKAEVTSLF
jgi:hypothetical protein